MATVKDRISMLRKERGLNATELGKMIGITYASISQYESGKRSPSTATQEKMADFFNVDVDYLMGRSETRRSVDVSGTIDNTVSSDEVDLIIAYRKASSSIQKAVRLMLGMEK